MVIDIEDSGFNEADVRNLIENETRYISPRVLNIREFDIGEWSDNHPLNHTFQDYVDIL